MILFESMRKYRTLNNESQANYTAISLDCSTMLRTSIPERIERAKKILNVSTDTEFGRKSGMSKSVVNQLKTGRMHSISATYAYKLEDDYGISARWLQLGEGSELAAPLCAREPKSEAYLPKDQILVDLDALEPEDVEVWRAKIKAAAIKARRLKEERDRDRAEKQPTDPPLEVRRA